jgi:hypothetical protein
MRRREFAASLVLALAGGPASAGRRDNAEECARIAARLREIGAKRRAGYTAKQGRRLQAQRDALEERRRAKCR